MFATLFLGVVNADSGVLAYINAGHEPLFVLDSKGAQRRLNPTGPAVGISPEMQFEVQMVEIKPGDTLFGFTDGVTEAVSPNGDFFTKNRLLSLLEQTDPSATDLVDRIKMNVLEHTGNSPISDDITMLAVKRLDAPVK